MPKTTEIILQLPTELLQTTEALIKEGKANSLDEMITQALEHEINQLKSEQPSFNSSNDFNNDPIWKLGKKPIAIDITDASENLDQYLYDSP